MANHLKLGQSGEDEACKYLEKKGYRILNRNFKTKWGELDIVAKNGNVIVLVEVKAIKKKPGFFAFDHIDYKKKSQLRKMSQIYLSSKRLSLDTPCQIDLIAIEFEAGEVVKFDHLENAIEDF